MHGRRETQEGKLDIDYDSLLAGKDEEPPSILIVKSNTAETRKDSAMAADHQHFEMEYIELRDHELDDRIKRHKQNIEGMSHKLPDKGEKLRLRLKQMEDEKERRRKLRRVETVCLEKDSGTIKPFDKELSLLGSCNLRKLKQWRVLTEGRQKSQSSGRHIPFKSPGNLPRNGDKCVLSCTDKKGRVSSILSRPIRETSSNFFARKKDASQVGNSVALRPRKAHTIDLEDEEEPQVIETTQWMEKLAKCRKDAKIYYPSRDDPEAVEISYSDIDCLAPQGYLTSTIMNFYISLHWSLVIICVPDKDEESGPIVLHLDSLGLHSSRSVFQNIKSFLKEEWHYLDQEGDLPDLPIADRIWRQLPQRITEKIISFGKQWFKPEEASCLRAKIRNVLNKEFEKACDIGCTSDASSSE
ncbi:hypothetical protein FNV43_RR26017 [Rhamnella rubrinervis]|uniref:Ubiquitin-like protease family profile domain-containing protein n=1 Tax=Rhamnella rubrinervis TaxID=2594499 RepID=A0A8K0DU72_9ROSA|nr:hypothetical protein FNV43_RR26017 [Rhamnella rubrinervis]